MASATGARGRRAPARAPRRRALPLEHRMLLTVTLCLLAYGAVMVYSASSARTLLSSGGDGTGYLMKYLMYGAIGLVLMRTLSRHGLEAVRSATPLILAAGFAGVLATFLPGIGIEVNGGRRWVGAGPLVFQPSELLKLGLVLYAARVIATQPKRMRTIKGMLNPLGIVVGGACLLVAVQPDLGTALVIAFTIAALFVAGGVPMSNLLKIAAVGVALVALFALLEPYRRARLTAFLDPWSDPGGAGFQSVQGQIALGNGGLFGVGLGQSVQKVFYLPEAHTDFILAVIGEELGIMGVSVLLFLYGLIAYAGLRTAKAAKGAYAKLLAAGITSLILCQAILNIFTVLGLAPLTGVPLPFISYGSSNLLVLLASMGLLLNIAAGGSAHLRAVPERTSGGKRDADADRDRRRRDRGARGAGARGRRRAAG